MGFFTYMYPYKATSLFQGSCFIVKEFYSDFREKIFFIKSKKDYIFKRNRPQTFLAKCHTNTILDLLKITNK